MYATTACPAAPETRLSRLLINRPFALLWSGQAISFLGDFIFNTTLALWIVTRLAANQPWAPLAVSGALVAAALPDLLVGPFAGVFVDRWDRRRTMLRMDALRALLIGLLILLSGLVPVPLLAGRHLPDTWQLGLIYVVVFLTGVCAQFFGPARLILIATLVPEERRPQASGLTQVTTSLSTIIGPALAAPLFFALGAGWALLLNALSFVVSFLAIQAVQLPPAPPRSPGERRSFRHELVEGLRFFLSNHVLTTVLVALVIVMLGGGALNALDIFFLTQNLHASTHLYGLLAAGGGIGALAGAILAGTCAQRFGVARTFWLSIITLGFLVLIYARLTSFAPALGVFCVIGVGSAAVNVVAGPLVMNVTPPALLGRVVSLLSPAISLASLLSIAAAGYLASTVLHGFHAQALGFDWGPIDTIFTATGLFVLAGGIYAWFKLREHPMR
jgi:MFS family permease